MPILVLAARLCPPGLESTIYSVLLSAYNLGLGLGSLVSAGLTAVRSVIEKLHGCCRRCRVCSTTVWIPV